MRAPESAVDGGRAGAALPEVVQVPQALRQGTFVVIAAFNEARVIRGVVRELVAAFPNVVVVDDGSSDATGPEACAGGAVVLTHLINRGQGAALQTGISYAVAQGAEYVVTFDADGQHRPSDVPQLLAPIAAGEVDICLGSRFLGHELEIPPARRLLLRAAVVFTWLTSGMRLSDAHNGLRAFSRRAAAKLDMRLDRMAHASEIVDQVRATELPYKEVAVSIRYTEYSLAKGQRSGAAFRIAFDYLIGRLTR
jgi:glycosyltransferase involved in cell wall biosynthesis